VKVANKKWSNFYAAHAACKKFRSVMASEWQLKTAQKAGLDQCDCGFVSSGRTQYPITKSFSKKCGGSRPGIRTCAVNYTKNKNGKSDVYCYSKTPYATGRLIMGVFFLRKVNKKWSMTFKEAKAACKKNNAVMASYGNIEAAYRAGMDQCNDCGFITNGRTVYPSRYKFRYRCGGLAGIKTCHVNYKYHKNGKADVYCYRKTISFERSVANVFHISNGLYTLTFNDAKRHCASFQARLATKKELDNAQRYGMDKCRCGYLSNGLAYYPITKTLTKECGGSKPGVRSCGKRTKADAYCYYTRQNCQTLGTPPLCGNFHPVCLRSGRKICASQKGRCWGSSKQFKCCNFCK